MRICLPTTCSSLAGPPVSPETLRPPIKKAVVASPAPRLLKDFFRYAYILLKVEAHSWPGKIVIAKIKVRGPGPAGLHLVNFLDYFNRKISTPRCQQKFFWLEGNCDMLKSMEASEKMWLSRVKENR
jgi:hypothetical protein